MSDKFILLFLLFSVVDAGLYNCTNAINTDYYRQVAFELHKQYRELVFQGLAPNKCGSLPRPKNYYKLEYNCDLEDSAATWATNCQYAYSSGTVRKGAGELLAYTYTATKTLAESLIAGFTQQALNAITTTGTGPNVTVSAYIKDWNHVAGAATHLVGCASKQCNANWVLTVCHYKDAYVDHSGRSYHPEKYFRGPYSGQMYTEGPGCTVNTDCDAVLQSTCQSGYCIAPASVSETANTQCPSNAKMNDAARDELLGWHNYFRSLVIKGGQPAGPNKTRVAPSGKNMYKMRYSCTIEANAQSYADTCPIPTHSAPSTRPGWGENMARMTVSGSTVAAMRLAVQLFYGELADYGLVDLITNNFTSADISAGHYTQVCWAKTYEVGCGIQTCGSDYHIVCQYNVAGNYLNEQVYQPGNPCTTDADCTTQVGDTCSTSDGLCVRA